ncbi:response regulator [Roseomonas nepalensis]|uniref:histidine kinase n=1 Tax=Muricoccus nepalensis TaxID=1854500 RepID=A0A502GGS0_9PROT|nr:ATP-binding protein [Roseomonas nepalensis]TPG61339.1 response regulator [Roseomonas nepalensis]
MVDSIRRALGLSRSVRAPESGLLAILDALPQGAALLDEADALLHANPALRRLLGPAVPLRPGTPVASLVGTDHRAALLAWLDAPGAPALEAELARPEGQAPTLAALRLAPLPNGPRLLLVEDLSERARRREEAAAGERLRAVGQLAGGIAHDINNLLSIIVSAVDQARVAAPGAAADLQPALDAAGRGAALVRRLLAFARRQQLEPRVVNLDDTVTAMTPMLRSLLGTRVALELRPNALGRRVRVDPVQLDQVLLNLATNARDAMAALPEGEARLTIATDTAVALREEPGIPDPLPPGRWVVLEVTDTGPGMPPEVLQRIVEPFFTTRAAQGGTGLGLATVHGIVRQSGGALQIESRPGRTRFRIALPRHEAEPAAPAATAAPPPGPEPANFNRAAPPTPRTRSLRILLVDDEAPLRRLSAVALERAGHQVTQAEDGDTALELVDDGLEPDALVTDITMPGMDGLALARALRARRPGLPVVLVSGYAEASLRDELAAPDTGPAPGGEGAAGQGRGLPPLHPRPTFLPKPYRPAELVETVAGLP